MGEKMQAYRFRNVDDMLDYLPENELAITHELRRIIFNCLPEIEEKLAYNTAFYRLNRNLCYLWPGAIYWGKKRSYEGVELGFSRGDLLSDPNKLLQKGERKQVYFLRIENHLTIDVKSLEQMLYEAALLDSSQKPNSSKHIRH